MQTVKLCEGVDLHVLEAPKFKTNVISLFFNIPLQRSTVTKAALLPSVMKRGTAQHKTFTEISKYLEEMYSASCSAGIRFKGDGEVIYFTIEYIRDRFTGESLSSKVIGFLKELVFAPLLADGAFRADYVTSEKENLKNTILGLINDKKEYADVRCREEMFGREGYGMFEAGYVEDLDGITPKNLYEFYRYIITEAKADLFISGSFEDGVQEELTTAFLEELKPRAAGYVATSIVGEASGEVKRVVEEIDVVQSKLCMGLCCGVEPTGRDYYSLMVGSCIFGGSPFAKLFNNVREKLSLAYYVFARTERFKSVMTISSGIQTEKYQAAYDEIMAQFHKMQEGDFDEAEIDAAKKYLTTGLHSMEDGLRSMEDYYLSQAIMGQSQDITDLLENLMQVTKEEIQQVMQKVKLDTVFFLKGNDEGGEE